MSMNAQGTDLEAVVDNTNSLINQTLHTELLQTQSQKLAENARNAMIRIESANNTNKVMEDLMTKTNTTEDSLPLDIVTGIQPKFEKAKDLGELPMDASKIMQEQMEATMTPEDRAKRALARLHSTPITNVGGVGNFSEGKIIK